MTDEPTLQEYGDTPDEEPLESGWWRLQGIFFEPVETFRQIARKPTFVLPLVAIALLGVAGSFFVIEQIGYENIVRKQIEQSPQVQNMSAAEREEIIQGQVNSTFFRYLAYGAPVLAIVPILIVAALLMLGIRILGSESSFRAIFSATCHSYFAQGLVSTVLICLVVWVSSDKTTIDTTNAVFSNPGFLVDRLQSPVLYAVASSLDLLSFYLIFLLALGLSTLDRKLSFGAALGVVLFWWALWVAGKVALTAIFS